MSFVMVAPLIFCTSYFISFCLLMQNLCSHSKSTLILIRVFLFTLFVLCFLWYCCCSWLFFDYFGWPNISHSVSLSPFSSQQRLTNYFLCYSNFIDMKNFHYNFYFLSLEKFRVVPFEARFFVLFCFSLSFSVSFSLSLVRRTCRYRYIIICLMYIFYVLFFGL